MVAATVTRQWVRVVRADLEGQAVVESCSGEHGAQVTTVTRSVLGTTTMNTNLILLEFT
jgi:hypothetical protein